MSALPKIFKGCKGNCTASGSYTTGPHSITFEVDGVEPQALFLKVDDGVALQIGSEWFSPPK